MWTHKDSIAVRGKKPVKPPRTFSVLSIFIKIEKKGTVRKAKGICGLVVCNMGWVQKVDREGSVKEILQG